jgi:hypothetical protein
MSREQLPSSSSYTHLVKSVLSIVFNNIQRKLSAHSLDIALKNGEFSNGHSSFILDDFQMYGVPSMFMPT